MSSVEQTLAGELERLAPADEIPPGDWRDVRRRARPRPAPRRLAVTLPLVAVAVAAPTLALSASVRSLVGLDKPPTPAFKQARQLVSAPIPGGRVARLWLAPSTDGGQCQFVTFDRAGRLTQPTQMTGGGACTLTGERFHGPLSWGFSSADPPILDGRVGNPAKVTRVELRWHGGSQRLGYAKGYFIAAAPALKKPPFRQLPYDVVALDKKGRMIERSRIPTSFLYSPDWKRVQPKLHRYRVAHGCSKTALWRCRTR